MRRYSPLLVLLLFHALCVTSSLSQEEKGYAVRGMVSDAATDSPLPDAILFIENSSVGTSSGPDGRFLLEFVPAGARDLVVSRVGYDRQILHLTGGRSDTLSLQIRLAPQPVSVKGVEVLGRGEAEARPFLFFPSPSEQLYGVYGHNTSLPIGILFTDSALYMCALDTAMIEGEKYVRLWILYKNLTDVAAEFDPLTTLRLSVSRNGLDYAGIAPVLPGDMMSLIPKRQAIEQFASRIQRTLDALLLIQWLYQVGYIRHMNVDAGEGTQAARSGQMQIRWNSDKGPPLTGVSTDYVSRIFQSSEHAGIFKKYTVYPGNSVDGFVYFPFPGLDKEARGFVEALQCHYELDILTPTGRRSIVFEAN